MNNHTESDTEVAFAFSCVTCGWTKDLNSHGWHMLSPETPVLPLLVFLFWWWRNRSPYCVVTTAIVQTRWHESAGGMPYKACKTTTTPQSVISDSQSVTSILADILYILVVDSFQSVSRIGPCRTGPGFPGFFKISSGESLRLTRL